MRYSSFCSKIPACNERSTLPSFINASQITNCTSQSVNFDLYYSLCTCRPLYYVTCACKPPSCAPSNITSFNVTCYTESSSICNYNQLDSKKVLAYNMQCYKEVIQILVSCHSWNVLSRYPQFFLFSLAFCRLHKFLQNASFFLLHVDFIKIFLRLIACLIQLIQNSDFDQILCIIYKIAFFE